MPMQGSRGASEENLSDFIPRDRVMGGVKMIVAHLELSLNVNDNTKSLLRLQ